MNTIRKLLCTLVVFLLAFTTACSDTKEFSKNKVKIREQSPAEVVDTALKSLQSNSFGDVSYFGEFDDSNLSGKLFYNAIFENMEYNIIKTSKNSDGTYTVEVEITNKNLKDLPSVNEISEMEEFEGLSTFELQTAIADAISQLDETVTERAEVVLIKGEKNFNITNKHTLYNVASGGYIENK